MLTLPILCISESWSEIKINSNFYFHTSLWCFKMLNLLRHHKEAFFLFLSGIGTLNVNDCNLSISVQFTLLRKILFLTFFWETTHPPLKTSNFGWTNKTCEKCKRFNDLGYIRNVLLLDFKGCHVSTSKKIKHLY